MSNADCRTPLYEKALDLTCKGSWSSSFFSFISMRCWGANFLGRQFPLQPGRIFLIQNHYLLEFGGLISKGSSPPFSQLCTQPTMMTQTSKKGGLGGLISKGSSPHLPISQICPYRTILPQASTELMLGGLVSKDSTPPPPSSDFVHKARYIVVQLVCRDLFAPFVLFQGCISLGWDSTVTVVMLLWRLSALTFTVNLKDSKKIKYSLNRVRAMPLANFTPKQFCLCVLKSPSKRALELQPNNYIEYIFSTRAKSITEIFAGEQNFYVFPLVILQLVWIVVAKKYLFVM